MESFKRTIVGWQIKKVRKVASPVLSRCLPSLSLGLSSLGLGLWLLGNFLPVGNFASKVMGHVRFGFAAGCEAVAMPRRQQPDYSRATPWSGLGPSDLLGQRPH